MAIPAMRCSPWSPPLTTTEIVIDSQFLLLWGLLTIELVDGTAVSCFFNLYTGNRLYH